MSMQPFAHHDATSVADASSALGAGNAVIIAGGTDLLSRLKDRNYPTYPATLVNIKTIPNKDYITPGSGTLKIGANAILADIASNSTVTGSYSLLSDAINTVASPHVRQVATLGGSLCQYVRCWYNRNPNNRFYCIRKGGTTCYAASGDNRYHQIMGAPKGCNAVYPSDSATALTALNATVVTNKKTVAIGSFFDELKGPILDPDELITEVDVPAPAAGSMQVWSKFRLRAAIDFAIVSVAANLTMSGTTVSAAKIVLGGVYQIPWESTEAEKALVGQTLNATTAAAAATAALSVATPLQYAQYKVPLLTTLITRALTPS